jgi:phosphatidyl-myo-inositol alpha-mannosyltransferase
VSGALRIGLVYDDTIDRYGGIGLYVTTLGRALSRRGHHVEYLLGTSKQRSVDGSPVRALARNVHVRFNGNLLSMPAWSRRGALRAALTQGRFDVLHVQVPYSPLMAGRLLSSCDERCAVIGTFHAASARLAPRAGAKLLRTACCFTDWRFDHMLAVSQTASDFARACSGLHVDEVLPNLIDVAEVNRDAHEPCQLPEADVVFVGRLVPRKGVEHLLLALSVLAGPRRRQCPRVAILGDGPLRKRLEQRATRLGLSDRVTFYGAVSDAQKASMLRRAQVACFPSVYGESFGVVVLEALAAGSQVVLAGDNPGYRELLGESIALVDPQDPEAFAERLALLLGDCRLRRSVGGRQRALLETCASQSVADRVEHAYRRALSIRRCADTRVRSSKAEGPVALA